MSGGDAIARIDRMREQLEALPSIASRVERVCALFERSSGPVARIEDLNALAAELDALERDFTTNSAAELAFVAMVGAPAAVLVPRWRAQVARIRARGTADA